MSVVIVGGNDCMVRRYKELCSEYNCQARVFTQMRDGLKNKFGSPDLLVLFTSTMSHKMMHCALNEVKGMNIPIERCHTSSASALRNILENHAR